MPTAVATPVISHNEPATADSRLSRPLPAALLLGAVVTGVLLGVSAPKSLSAANHVFAWITFVPLWLAVRPGTAAWRFIGAAFFGNVVAMLVGSWGIVTSVGIGWPLYLVYGGMQFTAPNLLLMLMRRLAGWRRAVLLAPAIWVVTEYALRQIEGNVLFATLSFMQLNGIWWTQFADICGEWGITFWVAALNSGIYLAMTNDDGTLRPVPAIMRRSAGTLAMLLIPAFAYSAFRMAQEDHRMAGAPPGDRLQVLLVQPNVDWSNSGASIGPYQAISRAAALTDRAVLERKPDLIVWPESSIPVSLYSDVRARQFVFQAVADWGTPLIGGTTGSLAPGSLALLPNRRFPTNAVMLIAPGAPGTGAAAVRIAGSHNKGRLVPFLEGVPSWLDSSWMRRWASAMPRAARYAKGNDRAMLGWTADSGVKYSSAAPICWEAYHSGDFVEYVRKGAQLFAVVSNDYWFGHGSAPGAIVRLRAIETRRPVVRVADAGITIVTDAAGRITAEAQPRQSTYLHAFVVSSSVLTPYTTCPWALPACCAMGILIVPVALKGKRRYTA